MVFLFIVAIIVAIGWAIVKSYKRSEERMKRVNEARRATMDENGQLRCKKCGCATFATERHPNMGWAETKCINCGQSWRTDL